MEQLFIFLYPAVAFVSTIGYIPQIIKLARARTRVEGISLQSWLTWTATSSISLGYGVFHLKDMMFCLTVGVSLASTAKVAALIWRNRMTKARVSKAAIAG